MPFDNWKYGPWPQSSEFMGHGAHTPTYTQWRSLHQYQDMFALFLSETEETEEENEKQHRNSCVKGGHTRFLGGEMEMAI